ncbi:unnamed protein product [Rhizopus stolonifer]
MVKIISNLALASSLHPKIITTIEHHDSLKTPDNCHLDLVYELPASVFVDPYQLKDLKLQATVFGEHDSELPLEKVKEPRGSLVFIRPNSDLIVELPIHTRYQKPRSLFSKQLISLKPPYAGWTCGNAPWPTLNHALLPSSSTRYPAFVSLLSQQEPLELFVPVGRAEDRTLVTLGTFCVVLLCTAWIARSIFVSVKKRKRTEAKGKRRKSD